MERLAARAMLEDASEGYGSRMLFRWIGRLLFAAIVARLMRRFLDRRSARA